MVDYKFLPFLLGRRLKDVDGFVKGVCQFLSEFFLWLWVFSDGGVYFFLECFWYLVLIKASG